MATSNASGDRYSVQVRYNKIGSGSRTTITKSISAHSPEQAGHLAQAQVLNEHPGCEAVIMKVTKR